MQNRLQRIESEKALAGVCAGLADYLDVDKTVVRVAFVLLAFASGVGIVLYAVMAVLMPSAENADKPISWERNLDDATDAVSDSVERLSQSNNGQTIIAAFAILLGVYFLAQNLGVRFRLEVLGPVLLIGLGTWLLLRRRS